MDSWIAALAADSEDRSTQCLAELLVDEDAIHAAYAIYVLQRAIDFQMDPSNEDRARPDPTPWLNAGPIESYLDVAVQGARDAIEYARRNDSSLDALFPPPEAVFDGRRLLPDELRVVIPFLRDLSRLLKSRYSLDIPLSEASLPPRPED